MGVASPRPEVRTHLPRAPPTRAAPPTASQNGALHPPPPPDPQLSPRTPGKGGATPEPPRQGVPSSLGPQATRPLAPEWGVPSPPRAPPSGTFRPSCRGSRRPSSARTGPLGPGRGVRRVHSGSGEGRKVRNRYLLSHRSPPPRPPPRSRPRLRRSPPRPAPPAPWPRADPPAGWRAAGRPEAATRAAAAAAEQQPPPAGERREGAGPRERGAGPGRGQALRPHALRASPIGTRGRGLVRQSPR